MFFFHEMGIFYDFSCVLEQLCPKKGGEQSFLSLLSTFVFGLIQESWASSPDMIVIFSFIMSAVSSPAVSSWSMI